MALLALCGCNSANQATMGVAPPLQATASVQDLAKMPKATPVILQGEMIEKCPVAGCWFMLRDKTGVVRVDTKAAGFVVSEVPLHTQMIVTGKVVPGTQPGLAATGIRY